MIFRFTHKEDAMRIRPGVWKAARFVRGGDVQAAGELRCGACGQAFTLSLAHRQWFLDRGLGVPRRCAACRKAGRDGRA
jgi:hypothetical protein